MSREATLPVLGQRAVFIALVLALLASAYAETLKNPRIIATSSDPLAVATADFNHDSNPDLAYINGPATTYNGRVLHVLLGGGNGTFAHGQDLNLPYGACGNRCYINVADVTSDGNLDLIIGVGGSSSGSVAVLLGNGDGTFQPPLMTSFTYGINYPALTNRFGIGDVNGDGRVDLVVPDAMNNGGVVLLGDNTGHFAWYGGTASALGDTYLQDLNGDGRLDTISFYFGGGATVCFGNGNGTFQTATYYSNPGSGIVFDVDGDGHPDIVSANYYGQIIVLKGKADGTFAASATVGNANVAVTVAAAGDYNQDGRVDLVVLNPAGIGVMLGTPDQTLGPMQSFVMGSARQGTVAVADFNGDGHPDLAIGTVGGIAVMNGMADGTFASGGDLYDMGKTVGSVAVGDFNSDGLPDIAVTLPAAVPRLLLGTGGGKFALGADPNTSYLYSSAGSSIVTGDFNGDVKLDLDVAQPSGSPTVFLGNGDGTFSAPISVPSATTKVADVNGDGRTDIITVSQGGSTVTLLGTTDATFPQVVTTLQNSLFPKFLATGDISRDGKIDLVITSNIPSVGGITVHVWTGNGDGSFSYGSALPASLAGQAQAGALTDLDGDGILDLVVVMESNSSSTLAVFYGNANGSFQNAVESPLGRLYKHVTASDVNQDGRPDLVLDDSGAIGVIFNLGNRSLDQELLYVAGAALGGVVVADVNGDGFPDLVAADSTGTTVAVLLNDPNGSPPGGESISKTISIAPEPSDYGQSFAVSIATSAPRAGLPEPTGSVTMTVDGVVAGTFALQAGAATYTASNLGAGTHVVIITYNGDAVYRPASFAVQHYVNPPVYATQTTLTVTPTTVYTSQTIRLTATVTSPDSPLKPLGIMTFYDGTDVIGSRIFNFISNGPADPTLAILDTALLKPGLHSISAVYNGYTIHNASYWETLAPSRSDTTLVTVASIPTTTTLALSSPNPTAGSVETLTATVAAAVGIPFGSVTFYDSGTVLGTMPLKANTTASYSMTWPARGRHNIVATFNANGTFAQSSSSMFTVEVTGSNLTGTTTSLSTADTGRLPGSTTLVARVEANGEPIQGEVFFLDGGSILGSGTLDNQGLATLTLPSSTGTHLLRASFAGNHTFAPSVSPSLEEDIPLSGPGFYLVPGVPSLSLSRDGSAELEVSVIPTADFQANVDLTCSSVSDAVSCAFTPLSLRGSGSSHLRLSMKQAVSDPGTSLWRSLSYTGLLVVALFAFVVPISRYRPPLLLMVICVGLVSLAGCGAKGPTGLTKSGATVITIRASSMQSNGPIVRSAQVVLRFSSR